MSRLIRSMTGAESSFPRLRRKDQGGQAMVLSVFTVGIVILVMLVLYSVGQQTIAKIKLQNTADAAAYSAAMAEARDYNFSAYINRAMVANQVAVAQVVGLTSWARNYGKTYDSDFSWVPQLLVDLGTSPLSRLWTVPWDINKRVGNGFRSTFNFVGPFIVKTLDALIDALGLVQAIYHYGTGLTVAQTVGFNIVGPDGLLTQLGLTEGSDELGGLTDLLTLNPAYDIVKLNDPDARLSLPGMVAVGVGMAQWFRFTENKDPNAAGKDGTDADRFAQVTIDSLDEFSRNRSTKDAWYSGAPEVFYLTPAPFLIDPTRFIPYQNGPFLMWLWHRGGTELKELDDKKKRTWSAMDATGFTGAAIFWISILGIPIPIPIIIPTMPMGWGAAQAGDKGDLSPGNNFGTSADDAYGGVYVGFNTAAPALIQRGESEWEPPLGKLPLSGGGLRKYFDVKDLTKDNLVGPSLMLEVEKSGDKVPNSNSHAAGRFSLVSGTQSNYMRALSKAQIYFSRPADLWPRDDGKTEQGSLYSPYWQARLVPNSFIEQYASMSYHLQ